MKQLSEFTINGGLKPDLSGVTIPIPINSNTLIRGLDKPSSLYLDALGARKSLIMNQKVINNGLYDIINLTYWGNIMINNII